MTHSVPTRRSSDLIAAEQERLKREAEAAEAARRKAAMDAAMAAEQQGRIQAAQADWGRSEEHTSELQSLMRTSSAVFCLKNKNQTPLHYRTQRSRPKQT